MQTYEVVWQKCAPRQPLGIETLKSSHLLTALTPLPPSLYPEGSNNNKQQGQNESASFHPSFTLGQKKSKNTKNGLSSLQRELPSFLCSIV